MNNSENGLNGLYGLGVFSYYVKVLIVLLSLCLG